MTEHMVLPNRLPRVLTPPWTPPRPTPCQHPRATELSNATLPHFTSDDPDDAMGTDEPEQCGYAVDDPGTSAVEAKTALINRALEETGMGRYQWSMCVRHAAQPCLRV